MPARQPWRRSVLTIVTAGVSGLAVVAAPAAASATSTFAPSVASRPGVDPVTASPTCTDTPRDLPINEFTSHAELGRELNRIERVSDGRVDVERAGLSNRGREIWSARVGTGPKVVLLTSEIHGNEKTGTDALLEVLRWVGTTESPKARQWRNELTIVAIPKMNPDGAELDRRGNDMTWAEVTARFPQLRGAQPSWNYYVDRTLQGDDYTATPGFDVNRDYHPDLDYSPKAEDFPGDSSQTGWYLSPETRTVRDVYRSLQREFGRVDTYVDLHHQGSCYVMPDDPSSYVTMSLSGKFVADPSTKPGFEKYAEDYRLDYSKQLNVATHRALKVAAERQPAFGNITLYNQDIDLPGTGLGSFALNGSGAVLFEVRGQTQSLGQEHRAVLTETVRIGLDGLLSGIASGSAEEMDPAEYDEIPLTGPRAGGTPSSLEQLED